MQRNIYARGVSVARSHARARGYNTDTIRIITGGRLVLTSPVCSPRQVGSLQLHDENMVTRLPRLTPHRTGSPVTGAERVGVGGEWGGLLPVRRGEAEPARVVSASAEVFVFQRELSSFRDCRFLLRLAATPGEGGA